jgi:hypothetical protein
MEDGFWFVLCNFFLSKHYRHYRGVLTGSGRYSPSDEKEDDTVVKRYGELIKKNKMYIAMLPYLGDMTR